jgi:tetratricopeptide (TPR) repeat protein
MRVRLSVFILFVTILAAGCGGPRKATGPQGWSHAVGSSGERMRMQQDNLFINANKEKMLGNYEQAVRMLKECISNDPKHHAAYYLLGNIYLNNLKDRDRAMEPSKKAVELDPKNSWYQMQLADIYFHHRDYREATNIYSRLIDMEPEKMSHYLSKADMEIRAGKYEDALKTYERVEKKFGFSESVIKNKEEIYISLGRYGKAIEEIKKLTLQYPTDLTYLGMLAELYVLNKMDDKAIELFNQILLLDPENGMAHFALSDYYREKGDKDRALDELKKAFSSRSDIKPKLTVMVGYLTRLQESSMLREEAMTLGELLVAAHPNESSAHIVYADILFNDKQYVKAREQYLAALAIDNSDFRIWQQLLLADDKLKDYKDLQEQTDKALELFPTQPALYLYNCFANMQLKNYSKVVSMAKQGIDISTGIDMKLQLYSTLGDAENFLKHYIASDEAFENALELDSNNTYVLNNYSYFLSLRGDKLSRAEELSRKSLQLEPQNPSYMDTYGWILYKQKRYGEAKEWVNKAIKAGGENGEVLEHYGDILFKLNDEAGALTYWKKAKELGSDSAVIDKKIRDGKYYE